MIWVGARARVTVLFCWRSHSATHSASLHPGLQVGTSQFNDGCVGQGKRDNDSMVWDSNNRE